MASTSSAGTPRRITRSQPIAPRRAIGGGVPPASFGWSAVGLPSGGIEVAMLGGHEGGVHHQQHIGGVERPVKKGAFAHRTAQTQTVALISGGILRMYARRSRSSLAIRSMR